MGAPLMRALLLGGGDILDYAAVTARLQPGDLVICADSGYDHCAALGVQPDLIVGDLDSVSSPLPPDVPCIPLPEEKNHTDTVHALDEALHRGATEILLAGMQSMRRFDHTLANLQSLVWLSRRGIRTSMTDGCCDIYMLTDEAMTLTPRPGYFSLIAMSERCEGVRITGAKYLLDDYTLTFDHPRAVSNEFLAGPATVSVRRGTMAVLCVPPDNLTG